jgi:peroxiredoxin
VLAVLWGACLLVSQTAAQAQSGAVPRPSAAREGGGAREVPGLTLPDLDGTRHDLRDWRGKVIVLNFWATWCGPCLCEIGNLVRYQDHGHEGLQVVGVGLGEERKLRNAARTLGINYPVLVADPAQAASLLAAWGDPQQALPHNVVLSRDGRWSYLRQGPLEDETFGGHVAPLLNVR